MGIEIPLWSCFVLIARIYSPFVLFLFQSFLSVITEARFYSLEGHYRLPQGAHRPALLARVAGATANQQLGNFILKWAPSVSTGSTTSNIPPPAIGKHCGSRQAMAPIMPRLC